MGLYAMVTRAIARAAGRSVRRLVLGSGTVTLVAVVMLGACVQTSTLTCPGGLVCPEGLTCATVASYPVCANQADLAACDGQPEGTDCDPQDPRKRCRDGVCINLCGNGRIDDGETCDDGNQIAGDTCSASCLIEECGNGEIDAVLGEECDFGTGLSGDGCSSGCRLETAAWTQLASGLTPRAFFALAHDVDRDEVVGFGGVGPDGYLADTWIWSHLDGRWRATRPPRTPPARSHHSIVYDRARQQVVLFGGYSSAGLFGDTWTWDGTTWTEHTGISPTARRSAQLAYDVVRQRVVLYGGSSATTISVGRAPGLTDTWEWDGTGWSERTPATTPPGARSSQLAYDASRSEMIACLSAIGVDLGQTGETWRWDGTNWINLNVACPSESRVHNVATYDPDTTSIVLFKQDQTLHVWNGTSWSSAGAPPPHTHPGFVHDGTTLLLIGGHADGELSDASGYTNLTSLWISSTWETSVDATRQPVATAQSTAAYAPRHGRALMYGGNEEPSETWWWGVGGWQHVPTATTPPPSNNAALAYDAARDRFVMFGGDQTSETRRTWEFDGNDWTEQLGDQPPARTSASMTYDEARGAVLLFGGRFGISPSVTYDDLWSWDGATWTELMPAARPSARRSAAFAYDPVRQRAVLFGGQAPLTSYLGDTWEWDGTTWTEIAPLGGVAPSPRGGARLVFHPLRQRMWLFGGNSFETHTYFSEAWEWDGVRWTLLHDDGRLTRQGHVAFFDTVRGGLVTFGGLRDLVTGRTGETWLLSLRAPGPAETCAVATDDADGDGRFGCADPDCFGRCAPLCPPLTSCDAGAPHCGDGTCDADLEDYALCPADCMP